MFANDGNNAISDSRAIRTRTNLRDIAVCRFVFEQASRSLSSRVTRPTTLTDAVLMIPTGSTEYTWVVSTCSRTFICVLNDTLQAVQRSGNLKEQGGSNRFAESWKGRDRDDHVALAAAG